MKELEELGYSIEEIAKMDKRSNEFKAFCFQVVKSFGDNEIKLKNIENVTNILVSEIIYYANVYKKEKLVDYSIPELAKEKKDGYLKIGYNADNQELIHHLLQIELDDVNYLVNFFMHNPQVYKNAVDYTGLITNLYIHDAKTQLKNFKDRLNVFREYLISKRELEKEKRQKVNDQRIREEATKFSQVILNDDEVKNFEEVKAKYQINYHNMQRYKQIYRETFVNGKLLFDMLEEKFDKNKKIVYEKPAEAVLNVLPLVANGIVIGNTLRQFDIFDCYTYFGKDLKIMIDVLRNKFSIHDPNEKEKYDAINKLKAILIKYTFKTVNYYCGEENATLEYQEEFMQKILSSNIEINQKIIDERLVRGSGHTVTENEKREMFNIIKKYHIPFNSDLFMLGLKRLNNGHFELITKETLNDYLENNDIKVQK